MSFTGCESDFVEIAQRGLGVCKVLYSHMNIMSVYLLYLSTIEKHYET